MRERSTTSAAVSSARPSRVSSIIDGVAGPERTILHVDMDAFFASVEQRDDPTLRGKPVLVGSRERRGVVAAASYEARKFGCRSAQPMAHALRLCPHAVVVFPHFARYVDASDRVFEILKTVTPVVEPLSIDEAFLDLTGTDRLLGPARAVAQGLRARIRADVSLTASVGIAPNKFLAKLASDLCKPDGIAQIGASNLDSILLPLPIERLPGVGTTTGERLRAIGLATVADVRARPVEDLVRRLGDFGEHLANLSRGIDERPVEAEGDAKSMGQEQTFSYDEETAEGVRAVLLSQCEEVARRVRRAGLRARGVTVKIRYGDFETITRSATLKAATDLTDDLRRAAFALFDRWARSGFRPVRLIGMSAGRFTRGEGQLDLFPDPAHERRRRLDATVDAIRLRHGDGAIGRAEAPNESKSRRR
jgi:DNA polymerase IV